MQLEFAHAILEARLREGFVDVKYRDPSPLGKGGHVISEVLHENSAVGVVETVENIASRIIDHTDWKRATVTVTPLNIMSSDIKLTIIEVQEHDV